MSEAQASPSPAEEAATLIARLAPEDDERAVFSAVYVVGDEGPHLLHASLLIGPSLMSEVPWAKWRVDSTTRLHPLLAELSAMPAEIEVSSAPTEDGTAVVAARTVMDVVDGERLLAGVFEHARLPATGPLPEAAALVEAPAALLHVFPRLWSPVARLAASAARPLRGFMLPLSAPREPVVAGDKWSVEGIDVFDGPWSPLGIAMSNVGQRMEAPAQGLLVGRLERRAWFDDVKGDGTFNRYELHIGLDPDRVDIADLEVELEEWADGGELVNSRRLLLGDLDLGARAGQHKVVVALPTLGRGLAHEARLYDRDGVLLDRTQRSKRVERVVATGRVTAPDGTTATHTFSAGQRLTVDVAERLERLDQLELDYRALLERGLESRIIRDRQTAIDVIADSLQAAGREIWILDPYFGRSPDDWTVLRNVAAPVRILTGSGAKKPPSAMTNVHVRAWIGAARNPLFHDRIYVWEGAGLTVGTSPSGFGKRDARIDRLRSVEADGWRALFAQYWNSSDFADV